MSHDEESFDVTRFALILGSHTELYAFEARLAGNSTE